MGRPKQHVSATARQAAYRQRMAKTTLVVDRQALERLHDRLDGLHTAITQAARVGHPVARQVMHASVETTLEALTAWFTTQKKEVKPG